MMSTSNRIFSPVYVRTYTEDTKAQGQPLGVRGKATLAMKYR